MWFRRSVSTRAVTLSRFLSTARSRRKALTTLVGGTPGFLALDNETTAKKGGKAMATRAKGPWQDRSGVLKKTGQTSMLGLVSVSAPRIDHVFVMNGGRSSSQAISGETTKEILSRQTHCQN